MTQCFDQRLDGSRIDHVPFKFGHSLLGHPALTLENLARVLPALPTDQVFYSSGLLKESDDFDRAHLDHRNGLSLEKTIETLRTGNSYIMVRAPETDPSFKPLFHQLLSEVEAVIAARGLPRRAYDPMLYLFIASPNSLTPFHIDRYSTFLLQFQGSKMVAVFDPWDERVVSAVDTEGFVARNGGRPPWKPEVDSLAHKFDFGPGEAIHIPFISGHYVKNGPSDVSVSMSIIFNTAETMRQLDALNFNHRSRKRLAALGYTPQPIGHNTLKDTTKARLFTSYSHAREALKRVRP